MNTIKDSIGFAFLVAGFLAVWFVTPASAFIYHGETGETCYEQSDGHGGTYWACSK
jgi:hypothetical protein